MNCCAFCNQQQRRYIYDNTKPFAASWIPHDDVIKWKHFSALLALCAGNSPVCSEFPAQRPVTQSFDIFFDPRLNKCLSKQSWDWWFERLSIPLWRHCNEKGLRRLHWLRGFLGTGDCTNGCRQYTTHNMFNDIFSRKHAPRLLLHIINSYLVDVIYMKRYSCWTKSRYTDELSRSFHVMSL